MKKITAISTLVFLCINSIDVAAQSRGKQTVCSVSGSQMVCREVDQPSGYLGSDQWCRLSPTGIVGRLAMCVYDTEGECARNLVNQRDACLVNPEFKPAESISPPVSKVDQPPIILTCGIRRIEDERSKAPVGPIQTETYIIRDDGSGVISVEQVDGVARYEGTINETMISFSRSFSAGRDVERFEISRVSGEIKKFFNYASESTIFEGNCRKFDRRF